jgi:hypothetical protein
MWRLLSFSIVVTAVALVSYKTTTYLRVRVLAATPRPTAAFTAKAVELQFDGQGRQTSTALRTVASNGRGVQVEILDYLNNRPMGNWTMLDLGNRVRVSVDPATESITTYPLSINAIATAHQIQASCADVPSTEHKYINGHITFKKIEERNSNTSRLHVVSWIAPTLNCIALESTATAYRSNLKLAEKNTRVTSIVVGEPEASLFILPTNFTERSPSQVFDELARRTGQECAGCAQSAGVLDEAYRSHRRR